MSVSELSIPFLTSNGVTGHFRIYEESINSLYEIDKAEALENCESEYQILEGKTYEYVLDKDFFLQPSEIVRQSKINLYSGRICPNIYVGTLTLEIFLKETKEKCSDIKLEVRSEKTSYREDYRLLLKDITEHCTDLVIQHSSPVSQTFTIDNNEDSRTLYQRFAFLKSVIDSEEFDDSVHKILSSPITQWAKTEIYKDIRSIRKANCKTIRQIAGAQNRMKLPENHSLFKTIQSVPQKIYHNHKRETVDTPENRFIKYALQSFLFFNEELKLFPKATIRLQKEASVLASKLEQYLSHSVFKEISRPILLCLNSPVLQKKEGYREILRTWLMFDLAAKLTWKGGDDVYSGGKRDIAVLYEYWLFFKLLDLIKEVFKIEPKSIEKLIKPTKDGLGLQLRQGKFIPLEGIYETKTRKLNIEFSYNKTFSSNEKYPYGGSWTRMMRPDYTLSIWPYGINQIQAEKEELIVHIHFDAKYKIEKLREIFIPETSLKKEKIEEKKGNYKRVDILKMHAYRDAIRRTAGAYILYPGSVSKNISGYHEIIPGLGAFPISPSNNDGAKDLKKFLYDVIEHFLNRASQREKMAYRTFEIYKDNKPNEIKELLPEAFGENRNLLPDETNVLIGFYKNTEHFEWIDKKGLYNARTESNLGSLSLGIRELTATYILLHRKNEVKTGHLYKIIEKGPKIYSKDELIKEKYPSAPSQLYYIVYKIEKLNEPELMNRKWDISLLEAYKTGRGSAIPFGVSMSELMKVSVK